MGRRSFPPEPLPSLPPDPNKPSPKQPPRISRPRRAVSSPSAPTKLASHETQSHSSNPRTSRASSRNKSKVPECPPHEELKVIPFGELAENKVLNRCEDTAGHHAEPAEIAVSGKEAVELQARNEESPVDHDADGTASESDDDEEEDDENEEEDGGNLEPLGEGFYEVEAVRRKRVRKGQEQYFIKWRGWPESANTWEPFDNVQACADIIEDFEKSLAAKQNRRGRGKRKFGTYILPQKKKRSNPYNPEEGGSGSFGVDDVGDQEHVTKSGSGPSNLCRESPEGLGNSKSVDAGIKTSQNSPNGKELDGPMLNCGLRNDQEMLHDKVIVSDAGNEAGVLNVTANQQEPRTVTLSASCLRADVSAGLQQPQEKGPPSVSEEVGPALPSVGGETGISSPFVGEEGACNCREKNVKGSMSNGHSDTKEEMMPMETGSSEGQLIQSSTVVLSEKEIVGKEIGCHSSRSCPGDITSGELGKAIGNDKCIGAKKRKQGFVRRVRQSSDSQDLDMKSTLDEENLKYSPDVPAQINVLKNSRLGTQDPSIVQLSEQHLANPWASTDGRAMAKGGSQHDLAADRPPHITKIIKAVNYSNAPVNGKQDVAVLFKALRYAHPIVREGVGASFCSREEWPKRLSKRQARYVLSELVHRLSFRKYLHLHPFFLEKQMLQGKQRHVGIPFTKQILTE